MSPGLRSGLIIVAIAIAIVASSGALLTYFERKNKNIMMYSREL